MLTQLPWRFQPNAIFQQSLYSGPLSIVSAAFVTDGTWPAGLQLPHSAALKPLGAWRQHMGRPPWHPPACSPDSRQRPGMSQFSLQLPGEFETPPQLTYFTFFYVFFHAKLTNTISFLHSCFCTCRLQHVFLPVSST